ncbi:MAG: carboxymuconolactone decarboxylase family protein [Rhodobacteraceae bacterium]|uniref:carboxymuconolactone decarboxylase family protein n=1 Tax=Tabrizicola sp. SY72 TaxID=2741673 RepID=UPI0015721F7A|nr:carboxymuconolactone decarboxylase family protein [Tabrizicola sp. SY72]MBL9057327.1 carboxymuconolactone decarboxylase family protein [Paracoccaceae bacterium]NTT86130.1 carboxymuconolactone decarboxylase family protein [Tabrizicola sp. SY72]
MTSYQEKTREIRNELRSLHKLNPETAKGFGALSAGAMADGPLDKKQREYVALAIAVTQRCEPCVNLHVEALMKAGASRAELGSVLAMCVQMGGGPALMYAAHALAAWDEFTAAAG